MRDAGDQGDPRLIVRCARCDAMVSYSSREGHADINIAFDLCGTKMPYLPVVDGDDFNVAMRVGRPLGRVAQFPGAR